MKENFTQIRFLGLPLLFYFLSLGSPSVFLSAIDLDALMMLISNSFIYFLIHEVKVLDTQAFSQELHNLRELHGTMRLIYISIELLNTSIKAH